jgi:hypothetical protein
MSPGTNQRRHCPDGPLESNRHYASTFESKRGDTDVPDRLPTKPLLVSGSVARKLIGCGNTKFWQLVKDGKVQMADVGGRRMVIYASLEALAQQHAT